MRFNCGWFVAFDHRLIYLKLLGRIGINLEPLELLLLSLSGVLHALVNRIVDIRHQVAPSCHIISFPLIDRSLHRTPMEKQKLTTIESNNHNRRWYGAPFVQSAGCSPMLLLLLMRSVYSTCCCCCLLLLWSLWIRLYLSHSSSS